MTAVTGMAPRCRVCRRVADLRDDGRIGAHARAPAGGSTLIQHLVPCEGAGSARLALWELRPEQAYLELAAAVASNADRERLLSLLRFYEFEGGQ